MKNGIVSEEGELYYYVDGVKTYAGLSRSMEITTTSTAPAKVVMTPHYWVKPLQRPSSAGLL